MRTRKSVDDSLTEDVRWRSFRFHRMKVDGVTVAKLLEISLHLVIAALLFTQTP